MIRTARRAASLAVAVVVAAVALTGCGAGQEAATDKPYDPSLGSVTLVGDIRIANVVVVTNTDGGLAELYTAFVNNGTRDDALTGVTVATASPVTLPDQVVDVPPGQIVELGPDGTRVLVHDLAAKIGDVVAVTFTFRDAGTTAAQVMVTTQEGLVAGS